LPDLDSRLGSSTTRFVRRRSRRVLFARCPLGARLQRTSRLRTRKGLQMQAFDEAAEGIRTLDLLHGKQ
jgi:hypothetical protein